MPNKANFTLNQINYKYSIVNTFSDIDYYAFGSLMPGRQFSSGTGYRYGFIGAEKDDKIKGSGNNYSIEARMYDSRLNRWLSIDPDFRNYPAYSPYTAFNNSPILMKDPSGKGVLVSTINTGSDKAYILVTATIYVYSEVAEIKDKIDGYANTIQNEINTAYNIGAVEGGMPIKFNVNVIAISEEEAVEMSVKNTSESVNFIHLNNIAPGGDDIGYSFTHGNSGSWNVGDNRRTNSYAHEFGHLMAWRTKEGGIVSDHPFTMMSAPTSIMGTSKEREPNKVNDFGMGGTKKFNFGLGLLGNSNNTESTSPKISLMPNDKRLQNRFEHISASTYSQSIGEQNTYQTYNSSQVQDAYRHSSEVSKDICDDVCK